MDVLDKEDNPMELSIHMVDGSSLDLLCSGYAVYGGFLTAALLDGTSISFNTQAVLMFTADGTPRDEQLHEDD